MVSLALAVTMLHAPIPAAKWCFVVAGDGRADLSKNRPEDKDGLNVLITGEIGQAAVQEKAKFLMWTGDLVFGYSKDPADFEKMLTTWRDTMKPVYDKRIPILACRGNHEAGAADSEKVWRKVFSGKYSMPDNGPDTEKNLSFYYEKGDVLAISLDQYTYGKEKINQPWLDSVLAKHHKPFIFSMGHEPAFMDGAHKDTMDVDPIARNAFWDSLINAGERVFFCGHDHLYDRMAVTKSGDKPGPIVHQIVAGTAGAPFYKEGEYAGKNVGWDLKRVKHIDNTYGYLLVEIEGKKASITFKGRTSPGNFEPMDSMTYMAN